MAEAGARFRGAAGRVPAAGGDIAQFTHEGNSSWSGPYNFVQMADSQLGMLRSAKGFQTVARLNRLLFGLLKRWLPVLEDLNPELSAEQADEAEKHMLSRAVQAINKLEPRPEFVCVCGDLVNAYPIHAELQASQVADFKALISQVDPDIPLVCVCGNHDIGDRPTAETIETYTQRFGDDYFVFWVRGVKYIVLNSQLYKDATGCPDLAAAQEEWLDRELRPEALAGARHAVVFSHVMPFVNDQDEGDGYFNISRGARRPLLDKLMGAGVKIWFCGHYHRNAGGFATSASGAKLEVVVTGAVGTNITPDPARDPLGLSGMAGVIVGPETSGLRVVRVGDDGVTHEWKSISDLEREAAPAS